MASTTLSVTVSGGTPPVTIRARCFFEGEHFLDISSPRSFSHHFMDLAPGLYDIYIMGFNPKNNKAKTVCALTLDEIKLLPPDESPKTETGVAYLVSFHFEVPKKKR